MAKDLFEEERVKKRLDGCFIAQEICRKSQENNVGYSWEMRAAIALKEMAEKLPLAISDHNIFVGTQSDAFAMSYALINPEFEVEKFTGYNDPCAVFNDIKPTMSLQKKELMIY